MSDGQIHHHDCSKCGGHNPRWPYQRYCPTCHAEYQRRWRARQKQIRIEEQAELAHLRTLLK